MASLCNQGFAFNWSRSDAETEDMIRTGQHTGLALQVSRGEVSVVIIFIGGNDFIHALGSELSGSSVNHVLRRAIVNLELAVETILAASPHVQVFIATVPDIMELPEFAAPARGPTVVGPDQLIHRGDRPVQLPHPDDGDQEKNGFR